MAWHGTPVDGQELVIHGPTGANSVLEGTFQVTLDHFVDEETFDCFFDSAGFEIPIAGHGFVVSNVQSPPRDTAGMRHEEGITLVTWHRSFRDVQENDITGEILSFDVHFEDGITGGLYTIGQEMHIGFFSVTCYDNGTPILVGDGIYHDNWGGRTFAQPEEVSVFTGDVNADRTVNLADVITLLAYLFQDNPAPACLKSADTNDDGSIDLSDAITALGYLFQDQSMTAPDGTTLSSDNVQCAPYLPADVQDVTDDNNPDPCAVECTP